MNHYRHAHIAFALFALSLAGTPLGIARAAVGLTNNSPADCQGQDFARSGKPVFFRSRKGVSYGISSSATTYTRQAKIVIHVWFDNQTSAPIHFASCGMFSFWDVAIWNQDGRRVFRKAGDLERLDCFSNVFFDIEPYTCRAANKIDVTGAFGDLPPGQYRIGELPWKPLSNDDLSSNGTPPDTDSSLIIAVTP